MATILDLVNSKRLLKLDPQLEPNEQEWRVIYVLPRLSSRLNTDLPGWASQWKVEQSPLKQMDSLFEIFCSGENLTFGTQFKPLNHLKDGIWELKTPDLRFFGWFHVKDCFIAGALDTAFNVKMHNLYPGYANEIGFYRDELPLNNPKHVSGSDPNDVVTNYNYP